MDARIAAGDLLSMTDATVDARADLAIACSDGGAGPSSTDLRRAVRTAVSPRRRTADAA